MVRYYSRKTEGVSYQEGYVLQALKKGSSGKENFFLCFRKNVNPKKVSESILQDIFHYWACWAWPIYLYWRLLNILYQVSILWYYTVFIYDHFCLFTQWSQQLCKKSFWYLPPYHWKKHEENGIWIRYPFKVYFSSLLACQEGSNYDSSQ